MTRPKKKQAEDQPQLDLGPAFSPAAPDVRAGTSIQALATVDLSLLRRRSVGKEYLSHEQLVEYWNRSFVNGYSLLREKLNPGDLIGTRENQVIIEALEDTMAEGELDEIGEPIVVDWYGRIINGRKRIAAAIRLGKGLHTYVVRGVDPEARFAIDDRPGKAAPAPVNGKRVINAPRARRTPIETLVGVPDDMKADAAAILALRDAFYLRIGERIVHRWNRDDLVAHVRSARRVKSSAGVDVAVAGFLRGCLTAIAPEDRAEEFLRTWAMPARAPTSAPALLRNSPHAAEARKANDPMALLAACVVAWRMFRNGVPGDPYKALAQIEVDVAVTLREIAFAKAHVFAVTETYGIETIEVEDIPELFEKSGEDLESYRDRKDPEYTELIENARDCDGLPFDGSTLKITVSNRIIDGLERLAASYYAGKPLTTVVVRGFADGYVHDIRIGRRQSYGQRLASETALKSFDIQSAARMIGLYLANRSKLPFSVMRHRLIHRRYATLQRTVERVHPHKFESLVPKRVSGAFHALASMLSPQEADLFIGTAIAFWADPRRVPVHRNERLIWRLIQELKTLHKEQDDPSLRESANHGSEKIQQTKFVWFIRTWNAIIEKADEVDFSMPDLDKPKPFPDFLDPRT